MRSSLKQTSSTPNLFVKPAKLSSIDSQNYFARQTKAMTQLKSEGRIAHEREMAKDAFLGLNFRLGSKGVLRSGSVPRHQFNYGAFGADMKDEKFGISKVRDSHDKNQDDWYSLKLKRILSEIKNRKRAEEET